jgi:hypothetical protein
MQSDFNLGGVSRTAVLALREPIRRQVVEVTGISGGQSGDTGAQADFRWGIPGVAGTFAGTANFQKFDDGWRMQSFAADLPSTVTLRFDQLPQPSAGLIASVRQSQQDGAKRQNEARQEGARRAAREQTAKTPTRQLEVFDFTRHESPDGFSPRTDITRRLEITDATVTITFADKKSVTLGLWQITGVRPDPNSDGLTIAYECSLCNPYGIPGDTADPTKAQRAINDINQAKSLWSRRFPDRATWIPVETRESFVPSPVEHVASNRTVTGGTGGGRADGGAPAKPEGSPVERALRAELATRPAAVARFTVRHAHGRANLLSKGEWPSCLGILFVFGDHLEYSPVGDTDGERHPLSIAASDIKEAALNRLRIGEFDAFHVELTDKRNFNFVSTEDRGAIIAAVQKIAPHR